MNEIKCPSCGKTFQIDETAYDNVVKQIRDKEFTKEIEMREKQFKQNEENALNLLKTKAEKELSEKLSEKEIVIEKLQHEIKTSLKETESELEKKFTNELNKKDTEIAELKNKIETLENENSLTLKNALSEKENEELKKLNDKEKEIEKLKSELKNIESQTKSKIEKEYLEELTKKETCINTLKNEMKVKDIENSLALKNSISKKDEEIISLNSKLESIKTEHLLKEKSIKENYEEKIKNKDEQIAYYKDFKARQSTKMIGESLEEHCHNEFNRIRPLFKNAYFEKDNDAKTGSKGDFIFRDYDDEGGEVVSIMFEMKNEADMTATKHKNEDFLKELDKDRKEKSCEYAVLVSLLEIDNDFYNTGIVDVSHRYEKMYVIRPQFFIPLITLIRNLALNSLDYKKELKTIKEQNIDISHFEENMTSFKEAFGRNYRLASEKFHRAIDEIDKTIDHLQKTKEALLSSENNLRLANNKAEDLTIKKLTSNSPTMAEMFSKIKNTEKDAS